MAAGAAAARAKQVNTRDRRRDVGARRDRDAQADLALNMASSFYSQASSKAGPTFGPDGYIRREYNIFRLQSVTPARSRCLRRWPAPLMIEHRFARRGHARPPFPPERRLHP